ncbi:MAG: ADP-ribosylglycohydrolase family protein [Clostridia bacterium]|nr:ADP-ribosylglycohydrolase family protein [Clostridia bacterium]
MYGAMIGDIVGSIYEFSNIRTKRFPLFSPGCAITDDTIITVAVGRAILKSRETRYEEFKKGKNAESGPGYQRILIGEMQALGRQYPNPMGAYGGSFARWLRSDDPQPYNSFGNGSAMRVSPCGLVAISLEEALTLARATSCVTHNHPEGVKGAEAVAAAIFLARTGRPKKDIGAYIRAHYYPMRETIDEIRPDYAFDGSCQGTVPQAITAFLESDSFEDALRNAISIGGDSDTIGVITGSIAWAYYGCYWRNPTMPEDMRRILDEARGYIPADFCETADALKELASARMGTYDRTGFCTPILTRDEEKHYFREWR